MAFSLSNTCWINISTSNTNSCIVQLPKRGQLIILEWLKCSVAYDSMSYLHLWSQWSWKGSQTKWCFLAHHKFYLICVGSTFSVQLNFQCYMFTAIHCRSLELSMTSQLPINLSHDITSSASLTRVEWVPKVVARHCNTVHTIIYKHTYIHSRIC